MLKKNLLLCVDVQVYLQKDAFLKPGKVYTGSLRNLRPEHGLCGKDLVFLETSEKKVTEKRRNPVIFTGGCVNVHLLADGSPSLAFNHPRFYPDFSFSDFCLAAAQELQTIARLFREEDPK